MPQLLSRKVRKVRNSVAWGRVSKNISSVTQSYCHAWIRAKSADLCPRFLFGKVIGIEHENGTQANVERSVTRLDRLQNINRSSHEKTDSIKWKTNLSPEVTRCKLKQRGCIHSRRQSRLPFYEVYGVSVKGLWNQEIRNSGVVSLENRIESANFKELCRIYKNLR